MNEWYCRIDGMEHGPLTPQDLKRMAESGKLGPDDAIKKTEAGKWQAAKSVKGLTFKSPPKPSAKAMPPSVIAPSERLCPSCNARLSSDAVLCVQCGFDFRIGKPRPSAAPAPKNYVLPLVGGAAALVVVLAAIPIYFFVIRGSDPRKTASQGALTNSAGGAVQPNRGAAVNTPVPVLPAGAASNPPGVVATPPAQGAANSAAHQAAVQKLLAEVANISESYVKEYEKMLADGGFLSRLLFVGSLPGLEPETTEVKRLGAEMVAIESLRKLIQEKRYAASKKDAIVCGQAVKAVGQMGQSAASELPLLRELVNHPELTVAIHSKVASDSIEDQVAGAELKIKDPAAYQEQQLLQGLWKPVSLESTTEGAQTPNEYAQVSIVGARFNLSVGRLQSQSRFTLSPAKEPKQIDLTNVETNEIVYGVYSLSGDQLILCTGFNGVRPKALRIAGEQSAVLMVLKKK